MDENYLCEKLRQNGIDVDGALSRMGNKKSIYIQFINEFFEDTDFVMLKESIDTNMPSEAFSYAHGIKGIAANLGLTNIYEIISSIVETLRKNSLEGTKEAYDALIFECQKVKDLIK